MKKHFLNLIPVSLAAIMTPLALLNATPAEQLPAVIKSQLEADTARTTPDYYKITSNYSYTRPLNCYSGSIGGPVGGLTGTETVNNEITPFMYNGSLQQLAQNVLVRAFQLDEILELKELSYASNVLTLKYPVEFRFSCTFRKPMYPDNGTHSTYANNPHFKPTNEPGSSSSLPGSIYSSSDGCRIVKDTIVQMRFTHDIYDYGIDMSKFPDFWRNVIDLNEPTTYRGYRSSNIGFHLDNEWLKKILVLAMNYMRIEEIIADPANAAIKDSEDFKILIRTFKYGAVFDKSIKETKYLVDASYLKQPKHDVNYWLAKIRNNESAKDMWGLTTKYCDMSESGVWFASGAEGKAMLDLFLQDQMSIMITWVTSGSNMIKELKTSIKFDKTKNIFTFGDEYKEVLTISYLNQLPDEKVMIRNIELFRTDKKAKDYVMQLGLDIGDETHSFESGESYVSTPTLDISRLLEFRSNLSLDDWDQFLSMNYLHDEISTENFIDSPSMWIDNPKILAALFKVKDDNSIPIIKDDTFVDYLQMSSNTLFENDNFNKYLADFKITATDINNKVDITLVYKDTNVNGDVLSENLKTKNFTLFLTPEYPPVSSDTTLVNPNIELSKIPEITDMENFVLDNFISYNETKDNVILHTKHSMQEWKRGVLTGIEIIEHSPQEIQGVIKYRDWINYNINSNPESDKMTDVYFSIVEKLIVPPMDNSTAEKVIGNDLLSETWIKVTLVVGSAILLALAVLAYLKIKKLRNKNIEKFETEMDELEETIDLS